MAIGNWDTLALDENSVPINGIFISPSGIIVEFYKNWLYLSDKKAWDKKSGWAKHVVMQIKEGDIFYKDVYITAKRGPKNGIYAIIYSIARGNKSNKYKVMIGIGCYSDKKGIKEKEIKFLSKLINKVETWSKKYNICYVFDEIIRNINLEKALKFNQGEAFFANHFNAEIPVNKIKC